MGIRPTMATLISRRLAPMQGSTWGHRMHPAAMTSPACHRYVRVDQPLSLRSRLGVELCDDLATLRSIALYSTFFSRRQLISRDSLSDVLCFLICQARTEGGGKFRTIQSYFISQGTSSVVSRSIDAQMPLSHSTCHMSVIAKMTKVPGLADLLFIPQPMFCSLTCTALFWAVATV
jgi:hypothetical protein